MPADSQPPGEPLPSGVAGVPGEASLHVAKGWALALSWVRIPSPILASAGVFLHLHSLICTMGLTPVPAPLGWDIESPWAQGATSPAQRDPTASSWSSWSL